MTAVAIFLGLFAAIVIIVAVPLFLAGRERRGPGVTEMVLIGAAAGSEEAQLWVAALHTAGIHAHVVNVGDFRPWSVPNAYGYEVWVPARDEARAHKVLGL